MASVKFRNPDTISGMENQQDADVDDGFGWKDDGVRIETMLTTSSNGYSRFSLDDDETNDRLIVQSIPSAIHDTDSPFNGAMVGSPAYARHLPSANNDTLNTPLFTAVSNGGADDDDCPANVVSNPQSDPSSVASLSSSPIIFVQKLTGASRRKARFCHRTKLRQPEQQENGNCSENEFLDRLKNGENRTCESSDLKDNNCPGASTRLTSAQNGLALSIIDSDCSETVNGARQNLSSTSLTVKSEPGANHIAMPIVPDSLCNATTITVDTRHTSVPANHNHARNSPDGNTDSFSSILARSYSCLPDETLHSQHVIAVPPNLSNRRKRTTNHKASDVNTTKPSASAPDQDETSSIEKRMGLLFWANGDFEEPLALEELEQFSKDFKRKRIKLGFTQGDVGLAMGKLYGTDFSQTTISRFEALNLSFKNMCKLKPLLDKWLTDTEIAVERGTFESQILEAQTSLEVTNAKRRKKRTSIEGNIRHTLEEIFLANSRPTVDELEVLAKELNMDREVIRVWFCNRRQKEKRVLVSDLPARDDADGSASAQSSPLPPSSKRLTTTAAAAPPPTSAVFLLLAMNAAAAVAAADYSKV